MSKPVPVVRMTPDQVEFGKHMWERSGQHGQLANSSFDAEDSAPKTWIVWIDGPDNPETGKPVMECELYVVPRASDSREGVGMLIMMCPNPACGTPAEPSHLVVREDNKQMSVERVPYRKAHPLIQAQWRRYCKRVLLRPVTDDDRIPVISSEEPWLCDYCKAWGCRVEAGIARFDMSRVNRLVVPLSMARQARVIGGGGGGKIDL